MFAFAATLSFVLVSVVEPYSGAYATTVAAPVVAPGEVQSVTIAGGHENVVARDGFEVVELPKPEPEPAPAPVAAASSAAAVLQAPAAGPADPGSAKAVAYDMVLSRGWGVEQYDCLVALWNKESGWNMYAQNPSSGAYGIPQALPGSKMASAGADWATNATTQIVWGLGYISGRYGTPCGAWAHSQSVNWY